MSGDKQQGKTVIKAKQCYWHMNKQIQIDAQKVHLETKTKLLNSRGTRFSSNLFAVGIGSRKGILATFKRVFLNLKSLQLKLQGSKHDDPVYAIPPTLVLSQFCKLENTFLSLCRASLLCHERQEDGQSPVLAMFPLATELVNCNPIISNLSLEGSEALQFT